MFTLNKKKGKTTPPSNSKIISSTTKSKKVNKTVFEDPFHYRISLVSAEDAVQIEKIVSKYLNSVREQQAPKPVRENRPNLIKFEKDHNIKEKRSPLVAQQIVIGIKQVKKAVYQAVQKRQGQNNSKDHMELVIVFYEERKHDMVEELLCLLKASFTPYILMHESQEINRCLGVRTTGSICFMEESFARNLLPFMGKSNTDIPWLISMSEFKQ